MKIFGIGLSKTGTSSLAHALEILGYRTKDYPGIQHYSPGDLSSIDPAVLENHDALTDTPIPSFYRELDQAFPGSKFILTVRDMDGWLLSCKKQFTVNHANAMNEAHRQLFLDLYGTTVFDEDKFRAGYERFVQGVMAYFADRPQDLLVLNITAGEGWEKLCPFLGKPMPDMPFPKANVTRIRWMDVHSLERIARAEGRPLLRLHQALRPVSELTPIDVLASIPLRLQVLFMGRERTVASVTRAVAGVIRDGLAALNKDIPVITRLESDVAFDVRKGWNHFWLVDPLDGEAALGSPRAEFSIDIALIEDRRPVAGVVYAPASGLAWYTMIGKGVYRHDGDTPPQRIERPGEGQVGAPGTWQPYTSRALAICAEAVGDAPPDGRHEGTSEWHSAAPHALARFLGRRLVRCDDAGELVYNKPDWGNPCLKVL